MISLCIIFAIILLWEKKIRNITPSLFLLFILFGSIDASMKYFKIRYPATDNNIFLIALFFSALVWSAAYILISKRKIELHAVTSGLFLGIPNFFSSYFVLLALSAGIPAYVTFPVINIGIIIASALAGRIIFSESLPARRIFFICLGSIAIILLTIEF
jgi:drug/metabolite transporter (DMT)-like permease